jgi:SAM-dependent methyltransferase
VGCIAEVVGIGMVDTGKQEREREFHNRAFADRTRRTLGGFYSIVRDARLEFEARLLPECEGLRVLEYGCGAGTYSAILAARGARVTGIDISDVAIEQASEKARSQGLSVQYLRMDAEQLEFPTDTFDIICGVAILHHLDLDKAFSSLARVMKPGGRAVFWEPLGHNPAINLFRRLTPQLRTKDEHPLLMRDLGTANAYFEKVDHRFFNLSTPLALPLRNTRVLNTILDVLNGLDRLTFALCPPMKRYAWQVVSVLEKPRKVIG